MILPFLLGVGTLLLGIGIEKLAPSYPGIYFVYIGLFIIVLTFIIGGYKQISKKFFTDETKKQLRPVYRVIRLNLDKWEAIKNGTIKQRKKSELN